MSHFANLYNCLQTRPRPEDVAQAVLEALEPGLTQHERRVIDKAARHSYKRMSYRWSSMSADFARPKTGVERQAKVASTIFKLEPLDLSASLDVSEIRKYVDKAYTLVGGRQKLPKARRRAVGIFSNARTYNKKMRLLRHMEEKLENLEWNQRKYKFTRIGKGGLGFDVSLSDISQDLNTACFLAYAASRMGMRSVFTNGQQERFFDTICETLLARCHASTSTRWDLIARVVPDEEVLVYLNDAQKGELLGRWWEILVDMAAMLKDCASEGSFDLDGMIVQGGNDSSTWNQVAGGWNRAREHWIGLVHSLNLDGILDVVCPGKVMRLMAADVAYWHRSSGGDIHPDTKVWAKLPRPWNVVSGTERCSRAEIAAACESAKVDPKSWIAGRSGRKAVEFCPTPELVNGVAVSSPSLAAALKGVGAFSGKGLKGPLPGAAVIRDANGFAVGAMEDYLINE